MGGFQRISELDGEMSSEVDESGTHDPSNPDRSLLQERAFKLSLALKRIFNRSKCLHAHKFLYELKMIQPQEKGSIRMLKRFKQR